MRRRASSIPRSTSAPASRPTCCRSRTRSRSPATPSSSASRGCPASTRRSSPTTKRASPTCATRIRKTIDFIQSVPAAQIDGTEEKDVVVPRRDGSMTLKGETYLKHVRAAELLLPRHDDVCAAAPLRRRIGQGRFPRPDAAEAGRPVTRGACCAAQWLTARSGVRGTAQRDPWIATRFDAARRICRLKCRSRAAIRRAASPWS